MERGDLLIQNAVVVSSKNCTPADILIREGKVNCPPPGSDRFTASLTYAYFAGRMDAFVPDEQLLERWRKETAFLARYIDSIVQEPPRNHCALTLARDAPGE